MPTDSSVLDEIIYARVLITLQRIQLDEQDRKLREHLGEILGADVESIEHCQESLKRAWLRASYALRIEDTASEGEALS